MHFNKIFVTIAMFAAGSAFAQNAEIGTWAGFRRGAASFTFDDGAPSHVSDAAPVFDKYGYKGTFNLVVNWNPNWSGFQSMANNGHEIASHSNSHGQNMSGEEASSKQNISGRINQKYGIITVAYPNCNVPNEGAVLQNYVVGRICNGSWQGQSDIMGKNGPGNWAKASAIMTGSEGSIKSTNDFTSNMQKAVQQGGWVAFLTHGFSNKNNGNANYSPTDLGAIEGALQWAKQNDKDIWVAPMGHVAMYIKERDNTKVQNASSDGNSISFELKHSIANNVSKFDYPLSVRVKSSWSSFEVTQNGTKLNAKADSGYIYFDAVPNGGKIVVSSGAGGNTGNTGGQQQQQQQQGGWNFGGDQQQQQGGWNFGGQQQQQQQQGGWNFGGQQQQQQQGGWNFGGQQQQQQQQGGWNFGGQQQQQQQSNCWSQQLGYPCCNQGTVVAYTDNYGQWGVQNNNWCGIANSNNKNCWAQALGYKCCSSYLCRIPQYSDTDGQWDVDGDQWCGISTNNIIC